ncbi:MAG: FecR domain-containing protein [Gammaproteobacteria bacterium]
MRNAFEICRRRYVQRRAREWAIRLDGGGLSARESRRLKSWLSQDENASALRSAQNVWKLSNATLDTSPASMTLRRWGRGTEAFAARRRAKFALVGVLAAACVAGVMLAPLALTAFTADASTSAGERRLLVLDDGSRVILNTSSAVDVKYTANRRIVRLLRGEAKFDVAPNPNLPFVVEAAGGTVTALGTSFVVRKVPLTEGGGALVTGVEHRVRVEADGGAVIVGPGQQASWHFAGTPGAPLGSHDSNATGWTQGILQFEDVPLRDIVHELSRYTREPIVVLGDAREMAVSGVFPTRNPVVGLAALESSRRLRLRYAPGFIVVTKD